MLEITFGHVSHQSSQWTRLPGFRSTARFNRASQKKALSQKSLTSSRFLRLTVNGFYMLRQYLYFRPLKFRFFTLPQQMDFDAAFVGCNLIKR